MDKKRGESNMAASDRIDFTKSDKQQFNSIMSALRRCWSRSPKRKVILDEAKHPTDKGPRGGARRICGVCKGSFGTNNLVVDHIDPVVPIDTPAKDMSWDEVVNRMFNSPKENLQPICDVCHKLKSAEENKERKRIQS